VDGSANEAVFINVAGEIDPVKLGQVANGMGFGGVLDGIVSPDTDAD
jgi:hypothetical protein